MLDHWIQIRLLGETIHNDISFEKQKDTRLFIQNRIGEVSNRDGCDLERVDHQKNNKNILNTEITPRKEIIGLSPYPTVVMV